MSFDEYEEFKQLLNITAKGNIFWLQISKDLGTTDLLV